VVKDDGSGFDTALSASRADNVDFDTVFGRGLLIMRTFMDEVRYSATGNEVTLVKRTIPVDESSFADAD
jgi:anti-sigma regulatory factor (Ser/Thr protein kinase)